jgi:hypothetical protein
MILKYRSGGEIRNGDRIRFHGEAAEVEFVVCDAANPETEWYFQELGGGVMILDPKVSGRTFIPASDLDDTDDLVFVSRAGSPSRDLK